MSDTLVKAQRRTVRAQQLGNQLGWGTVTLGLVVGFHLLAELVVNRRLSGCCGLWSVTLSATAFDVAATVGLWGIRLGLSVALGSLIGIISAEYVRARPTAAATTVASAYVALASSALVFATEMRGSDLPAIAGYVLLIAITVPVARAWPGRRIR
jgi:hypothetical protein